jgi:CHAT domain
MRAERDALDLHLKAALLERGLLDRVRGVRLPRPDSPQLRMLAAEVAASRSVAEGRPGAAMATIAAALDEAQLLRTRLGSLDLATSLSSRTQRLSRAGLDLALASGHRGRVLEWSERSRAQASRIVPVRRPADPLLAVLAADLDLAASGVGGRFRGVVRDSLAATLRSLNDLLIARILDAVGDRSLVLTPSAPLHLMPWGLLPGLTGRPVTVARSATNWVAAREDGPPPGAPRRVLVVAGPGLTHADAEVDAVAAGWGPVASRLQGPDATAAAVARELGRDGVDVVHVAAPGRHVAENPLFSRLDLADGPLFGYDLDALPAPPRLVVLSACDLGLPTMRGDDPLGLPTALLHGGVHTVVAASARVGDAASRATCEALHGVLARGAPPAAALAQALAAVRSEHIAPFVSFGAGW